MATSWNYNRLDASPQQHRLSQQSTVYDPHSPRFPQLSPGYEPKPASGQEQYELLKPQLYDNSPPLSSNYPPEFVNTVRRRSRWAWDWWPETVGILFAIACFAAIVVLLLLYENKPLPDFPTGITINAVLSVLLVSMKGALLMTIEECLSQLKWSWFKRDRRLADLVLLDEASRGPWGAAKLVCSWRTWYLAYIGSFMILLSLAVGPTVQQVVQVQIRHDNVIAGELSTMPVCNTSNFDIAGLQTATGQPRVKLPVVAAMYDGLLKTQTSVWSPLEPGCRTGNCTFLTYQSLGITANCQDISSQLEYHQSSSKRQEYGTAYTTITAQDCAKDINACQANLPAYGLVLRPSGAINSTTDSGQASKTQQGDPPFYIWRAILARGASNSTAPPRIAVECSLHFAVYTYKANVTYGKLWEKVISTSSEGSSLDGANSSWNSSSTLTLTANPCFVQGEVLTDQQRAASADKCTYKVNANNGVALANTLDAIGLTGEGAQSSNDLPTFSSDVLQSITGYFNATSQRNPNVGSLDYVNRAFQTLATSLTNHVRGSKAVCGGATIQGNVMQDKVFLHVRWIWLAPSAAMLLICLVFFVTVLIKFKGVDCWKSSPMAFLGSRIRMDGRELSTVEVANLLNGRAVEVRGTTRQRAEKAAKGLIVSFGPVN